ncbi:hypothetical protein QWT69_16295 [Sporosarcina oncorhynchi]|uniref:Apolipoprotein N-acyltransferase n=1 Tax=Sporosarcina oncorhynchi TaxID=3056444 RepID=A0ABZ0L625_9BACL|nr:hypothetical protein [Sporosarcina sp. T2O-4]WOV87388.1 hypothetical protein QWT69_16295 [Sporosarcina sp. T2O-4]
MNSKKSYIFYIVLILIPLAYGFLVNNLMIPLSPFFAQLVFLVFWFYVGFRFSKLNMAAWKSFLLGNVAWLISFILFVWQFIVLDSASRSMELALLSQHYMLAFVFGAARLLPFMSNGTTIIFNAYIFMLITFTLGFLMKNEIGRSKAHG